MDVPETSTPANKMKPLGIRATAEQHRIITAAAKREHRSVNSFVVNAALRAAVEPKRERSAEAIQAAIARAQELMQGVRESGRSLVDEVIAERRAEAARE